MNAVGRAAPAPAGAEPVAIIGIGCRYPGGVTDIDGFWDLLVRAEVVVGDVPADRWDAERFHDPEPGAPGKTYVTRGSFLSGWSPYEFDLAGFGIHPREVGVLDPQQRLLLEVAFEALEDAGLPQEALAGTDAGVFVGAFALDNFVTRSSPLNRRSISPASVTSSAVTMVANRLSYVFDLRGPSVAVDTACSSSLVALHLAVEALRRGECAVALAGGVNVMYRPEYPIQMSAGQFLSPDGRSKSFDARADGYGRGEGAGMLVLKPLSAAMRDGDRIHALVRGTGVNHDGRTPAFSVPSGAAQEALVRRVLEEAAADPADVRFVEAHGTGTPVGDPVECRAIGAVLGAGRKTPCPIASAKGSIGHQEAGAGVAGVIKAALSLGHGKVPPQAGLETANPAIPFDELNLLLPRAPVPLPEDGRPWLAAVNAFGYGGTNGHALLERAPPDCAPLAAPRVNAVPEGRPRILVLSAHDPAALAETARRFAERIVGADHRALDDVCHTAALRRTHCPERLVAEGADAALIAAALGRFAAQGQAEGVTVGRSRRGAAWDREPLFVYTGMGPQWWGMGRRLMAGEPEFRAAAERCDEAFRALAGWSILAEMMAEEAASRMADTRVAQPANAVLQVALTDLLAHFGVRPAAVLGHSVGEAAAAYAAGMLTVEEVMAVTFHRSQLQARMAGKGAMLALGVAPAEAEAFAADCAGAVSLAAVNGPRSVTLAGERAALERIAAAVEEDGRFARFLRVEVAYHSHQMDGLLEELAARLAGLSPSPPRIPVYSSVTGARVAGDRLFDGRYWARNTREPVRFADALGAAAAAGHRVFLEVGPHPVLAPAIRECLAGDAAPAAILCAQRRDEADERVLLAAVGGLHAHGLSPDWRRLLRPGRHVTLPTYPWQRQRYWQETREALADRLGDGSHPLLGTASDAPRRTWQGEVNAVRLPWLHDHAIGGATVLPAAATLEAALALHAVGERACGVMVEDVRIESALVAARPESGRRQRRRQRSRAEPVLRTELDADGRRFVLSFRDLAVEDGPWVRHAVGHLSEGRATAPPPLDVEELRRAAAGTVEGTDLYREFAARGAVYGPAFRTVVRLHHLAGGALAELELPEAVADARYHLHPALLDGAIQALVGAMAARTGNDGLQVPVAVRQLRVHGRPGRRMLAHAVFGRMDAASASGDVALLDHDGAVVAEVRGLLCRPLSPAGREPDSWRRLIHRIAFVEKAREGRTGAAGRWLVLGDDGGVAARLAEEIVLSGGSATVLSPRERARLPEVLCEAAAARVFGGVVDLTALDADEARAGIDAASTLLATVKTLARAAAPPRFVLVTTGAVAAAPGDPVAHPWQAAALGLLRTAAAELPHLEARAVDLPADPSPAILRDLVAEIACADGETEVALRPSGRMVPRAEALPDPDTVAGRAPRMEVPGTVPMELVLNQRGRLESLAWRRSDRRRPTGDEVLLAVQAVSVNFKDVLKCLGMLPPEALEGTWHGTGLGMEVAARVVQAGPDVRTLKVGDAIVAQPRDGFRSLVLARESALPWTRQIEALTPAENAALPVAFATAWYTLRVRADVQPGERVLVHAGAGGVGQAAIAVAKWLKAEVYATAGTEEKRALLRAQGCRGVYDSRSLDFAEAILADTGGRGVDVVLNSLAGEAVRRSLAVLAPHGRFVEIGKRDLLAGSDMGMAPFNKALTFHAVDLDRLTADRPDVVRRVTAEVFALLGSGEIAPPAPTVMDAQDVGEAFRMLAQSRNVGKVVVSLRSIEPVPVLPRHRRPDEMVRRDRSYLVTGGLTGLGRELARALARAGAGTLVLVGRRGTESPGAADLVAELEALGTRVVLEAVDVADGASVHALVGRIAAGCAPLAGVFHAAGVLDDAPIAEQTAERVSAVMAPKALGAWHLHAALEGMTVDHFVLFSSLAAVVGNAGQAGYAAANAVLGALALRRRALGLAALVVDLGPVARVGMAARNDAVEARLAAMGMRSLDPRQVVDALIGLMAADAASAILCDVDWSRLASAIPSLAAAPRFERLVARAEGARGLGDALAALSPADRRRELVGVMAKVLAETLRLPVEKVEPEKPFADLGLDSLMTVELQTGLSARLGVEFSVMELMKGASLLQLADLALRKFGLAGDDDAVAADPPPDGPAGAAVRSGEALPERFDAAVREIVAIQAGLPVDAVTSGASLASLGLTRAAIADLLVALQDRLGVSIPLNHERRERVVAGRATVAEVAGIVAGAGAEPAQ